MRASIHLLLSAKDDASLVSSAAAANALAATSVAFALAKVALEAESSASFAAWVAFPAN